MEWISNKERKELSYSSNLLTLALVAAPLRRCTARTPGRKAQLGSPLGKYCYRVEFTWNIVKTTEPGYNQLIPFIDALQVTL